MRRFFVFFITLYQKTLSPDQGIFQYGRTTQTSTCLFYPTCSEYAKYAIKKHGVYKGIGLSVRRVRRCTPFTDPQVDHIP